MGDDRATEAARVRENHNLHWLALIGVSIWAGGVFGWLTGLATFAGLFVAISLTNIAIIATTGSFRALRVSRWSWLVAGFVAILFFSASIETA